MSERDEYRERVQAKLDRARRITPPTSEDNWDQGYIGGLSEVLAEYDRLAPERERERLALALVESLTVTGRRCPENCILQPSCYYLADGAKLPCLVLRERCIQLGILPPEEAK